MRETSFEELLRRDGVLVYKVKGVSMLPMLRQNRDLVVISRPEGRLRPYDVALYRRGGKYVLHRVLRVREEDYLIRGDNCLALEEIPAQDVLGVLTAFVRDGKRIPVTDRRYRRYARVWCALYPARRVFLRARGLAGRVVRRMRRRWNQRKEQRHGH